MPIGPIVTDEAQGNTVDSGTSGAGTVVGGLGAIEVDVELDGTVDDGDSTVDVVVEDVEDVEVVVPIDDVDSPRRPLGRATGAPRGAGAGGGE